MNKMEEVAKILGVQLGEKFDVEGYCFNPYTITSNGAINNYGDGSNGMLVNLIKGDIKIIKRPFKPAKGDGYWSVDSIGKVYPDLNNHYSEDYYRISSGNCFRTEAEAKAAAPEIVKKIQEFFAEV